ncbi:hypothetical protein CEP52_007694 [Fusarium oligoseptatum]|uniref:Uncharacterized protein n=1 Tax=Fusarium oligoseptatum TaxID=2604345 RepID=A0A428TLG5_9HYPO|nr:hypothetical protein CEP52_007694 [Fusarium oligoseptatum]
MPYDSALSDVLRKQQQHLEPIHGRRDHDGDISHIALNALYPDEEFTNLQGEDKKPKPTATYHENDPSPRTPARAPEKHGTPTAKWHLSATAQRPERLIPSTFWSEAEPVRLFASIDPGPARRMEAKRSHVIQLPVFSADRSPSLSRAVHPSTSPLKALHDRVRGIDRIVFPIKIELLENLE